MRFFHVFHRLEALWAALRLPLRRAVPENYFLLSVEPPEELELDGVGLLDGVDAVLAVEVDAVALSPEEDESPPFTEPALPAALLPA